ncbi:MAG: type II secretion system protein [Clostridia bacterium]|nr:type II secretion system protein [Clostridia bacterium]
MKLKSEKGFTGIDIAISIVVLFIFVSLIASLIYNYNISSKEATRKSTALELAINEIENIKTKEIDAINNETTETTEEGFFKTIEIKDYADIAKEPKEENIVKKVTVKISYMSNGKEENVELSTIVTKES